MATVLSYNVEHGEFSVFLRQNNMKIVLPIPLTELFDFNMASSLAICVAVSKEGYSKISGSTSLNVMLI